MKRTLLLLMTSTGLSWSASAQHGHLNAGALGQNQGDKLAFINGSIFAEQSGYAKALTAQSSGNYSGFYQGSITLTALPTTVANGGPAAGASAPGSFLEARIASVQGPAGGYFSFWEEGATAPTVSYQTGTTGGTTTFALSDVSTGAGTVGGDPFGHLHGRSFTTTLPGEYTVGIALIDSSKNGLNGGAIHVDSDTLFIRFQTVPEPATSALLGVGGAAVVVGMGWRHRNRRLSHVKGQ